MAESIIKLKKQAREAGMPANEARAAGREKLVAFLKDASKPKASKKAVAKKKHKANKARAAEKAAPTKKATKKAAAKKSSTKKTTKATTTKKRSDSDTGRAAIGKINWTKESDNWNPKPGGPVERLFKALKKKNGDVDKAFELLKDDVYDFVGRKKRNGDKRSKAEAHAMLKYRLNRTKFEFATRTGQHSVATNRVEYGTGEYASTRKKTAAASKKKASTKKASGKKKTTSAASKKKTKKNKK